MIKTKEDIQTDVQVSQRFEAAKDVKIIESLTKGGGNALHAQREIYPYITCASSPFFTKK